jgi:hypothetical protein
MRRWALPLLAANVLGLCGCYKLDSFLYSRRRTDAYQFQLAGEDALSTLPSAAQIQPVRIQVDGQVSLGAVHLRATGEGSGVWALFFHGNGPPISEESQFKRAKRLANLGYEVLAIDYRGWGTSTDVDPTEAGVEEDTRAALQWVLSQPGASRDRLVYYGHSFGTAVAVQRAAIDPPAALVLEAPFASIREFAEDASGGMNFPGEYVTEDSWESSERIRSIPGALFIHGTADDLIRHEFSEVLYQNAPEPKHLRLVEGGTHDSCPRLLGEEFRTLVDGWVQARMEQP